MKIHIVVSVLFFCVGSLAYADIPEIKKIYYSTNKHIETSSIKPICFVEIYKNKTNVFQDCSVSLEKYTGWSAEYQVFLHDFKIIKIKIISSSSSGDWSDESDYYFYPSLNIAFIFQNYRTFLGFQDEESPYDNSDGIYIIERRLYFSKKGRVLEDMRRNEFELYKTKKRIKLENKMMKYDKPTIYKNIPSFSIYKLLKKKKLIK